MASRFDIDTTALRRTILGAAEDFAGFTDMERAEQAKEAATQEFMQAYQAKDPDAMAQFIARNPQMQKQMETAIGHRNEATKNSRLLTQRKILANPDEAIPTLKSHIAFVQSQGGDTTESEEMLKRFEEGDPGVLEDTKLGFAMLAPAQMYEAYRAQTVGDPLKKQEMELKKQDMELKKAGIDIKRRELSQKDRSLDQRDIELLKKGEIPNEKILEMEGKMRKEVNGITKDYRGVNDSYGRILASAENPSAAGDLALIFNYMKVLDPGSTVREGEFATAQNAGGVTTRIRSLYNNISKGERLTESQRTDFIDRAQRLYGQATENYKSRTDSYKQLAVRSNLNPENIIMDQQLFDLDQGTSQEQKPLPQPQSPQSAAAQAMPEAQIPLTNAHGWRLMRDASGNQAYVGPNGEVQEVR